MPRMSRDKEDGIPVENVEFSVPVKGSEDNVQTVVDNSSQYDTMPNANNDAIQSDGDQLAAMYADPAYQSWWLHQQQWQAYYAYQQQQQGMIPYTHSEAPGYHQQQQQQHPQTHYQNAYTPWPQARPSEPNRNNQSVNYSGYIPPMATGANEYAHHHQRGNSTSSAPPSLVPSHKKDQRSNRIVHDRIDEAPDVYAALLQNSGSAPTASYGAFNSKSPRSRHKQPTNNNGLPPSRSRNNLQELNAPLPTAHRHHRSSSDPRISHRRSSSDGLHRMKHTQRRTKVVTDPTRMAQKRFDPVALVRGRSRSFSARSNNSPSSSGVRRSRHRRDSSMASQVSIMSEASMKSIVSDIRRSTFFGGHKDNGTAQLHFPFENVHLVPTKSFYPRLKRGSLYAVTVDDEVFEDYHLAAEGTMMSFDDDDDLDVCHCDCLNCATCSHKKARLPENYFLLGVEDNLYRRVVDEMCSSINMPCGLFFCGHHEDVSRPSISIAVVLLLGFFLGMGYVAYWTQST